MTDRLIRSSFNGTFPRIRPPRAMCTENEIPASGRPESHPGGLRRWPGVPNGCQSWSESSDQDCTHGDGRAMGCPGRACTCRTGCWEAQVWVQWPHHAAWGGPMGASMSPDGRRVLPWPAMPARWCTRVHAPWRGGERRRGTEASGAGVPSSYNRFPLGSPTL